MAKVLEVWKVHDFVALEKEINYISDYIELQRLRIADASNLEYVVSGNPKGKHISPLVIIPFIENAFKYGVNAEEDWHISIRIDVAENVMTLDVVNNQVSISLPEEMTTEQGIENTQKRLDLVYPGEHELEIDDNEKTFNVHLKIQLSWSGQSQLTTSRSHLR